MLDFDPFTDEIPKQKIKVNESSSFIDTIQLLLFAQITDMTIKLTKPFERCK